MANTMSNRVRVMVECAVMIALSTVLSMIKLIDLPYGGSVTIASMLPVIIISYRHGLGWGLGTGLVHAVIQQLLGLSSLQWVSTWQSILAVVLLDYIIAFMVTGLGGIFRHVVKNQATALSLGTLFVCVLRYLCHVITGATVWAGISIPTKAALIYSLGYNATYMLPETIITVIVACYLGATVDFRKTIPTRISADVVSVRSAMYSAIAGLVGVGVIAYDVAMIFSKLQNGETGDFLITGLKDVNWMPVVLVTVIGIVVAAILVVFGKNKKTSSYDMPSVK